MYGNSHHAMSSPNLPSVRRAFDLACVLFRYVCVRACIICNENQSSDVQLKRKCVSLICQATTGQKFLCPFEWIGLPSDLTDSKFLSVLAILTHTVFGIRHTKMCVFICLPFRTFFVILSPVFLLSLDFLRPHGILLANVYRF